MPNWCYNAITISGTEESLNVLDENFAKAREHKGTESCFGEKWLGQMVEYLGYDASKVRCRGYILDYHHTPEEICISTETAWGPLLEPILLMVEKFAPDSEITYFCEEPGCDIYLTNDPTLEGKYILDVWDDEISDYERDPLSHDELKDWLEDILKKKKGLPSLLKEALSEYDFCVHQYEYCAIEEL